MEVVGLMLLATTTSISQEKASLFSCLTTWKYLDSEFFAARSRDPTTSFSQEKLHYFDAIFGLQAGLLTRGPPNSRTC